ncbi:MAG: hypothetical protein M3N93_01515 [Acidobacteriota bacterium]|nr:hypothetical protein [Acidobacteriota bacterium]
MQFIPFLVMIAATPLACFLVPQNPNLGGMRLPAVMLAIGILAKPCLDATRRGLRALYSIDTVLCLSIVYFHLLELIEGLYPLEVSREAVIGAFLMIATFRCAILLGLSMNAWRLPRAVTSLASRRYSSRGLFCILTIFFCLGVFNYAFNSNFSLQTFETNLLSPRFEATWSRGALGGWDAFTDNMTYFGYLLPTWTVLLARQLKRWLDPRVILGWLYSIIFLACVTQGGGRRLLGVIIGSAILMYMLTAGKHWLRTGVISILSAGLLLGGLELVLQNRNRGYGDFSYHEVSAVNIDDNFLRVSQVYEIFPDHVPYTGLQAVIYAVVRPVPRIFWENKPVDMGFDLAKYLGFEGVGFTMSIVGEAYMSWGFSGVFLVGLFLGKLIKMWQALDQSKTLSSFALYSLGCMAMFSGVRSIVELILMSYPILFWVVSDKVMRLLFRNKKDVVAKPRFVVLPGV